MKKRINAWVDRHPQLSIALSTLLLLGVISGLFSLGNGPSPITVAAKATSASQANDLTYASDLTSLLSNKDRITSGLLPVTVLSINDYTNFLASSPKVLNATLNPETRITASTVKDSHGGIMLYAAYFLPNQSDALMKQYTAIKAPVAITPPSDTASTPSTAAFGRYSYLQNTSSTPKDRSSSNGFIKIILTLIGFMLIVTYFSRRAAKKNIIKKQETEASNIPETRFKDIAGCTEAVEEMRELVMLLREPDTFAKTGARVPKAALLTGPPGTGKTMLARAVAGEAGVPFYTKSGSDFVELYVGAGPKHVRELFADAARHPEGAIIFIDEIDAVGRARSDGPSSTANQEHEGTLNALLVEMDGFKKHNIIVIGATNRPDMLDPALTRGGRFGKKINVPLPDRLGREEILKVHTIGKPLGEDVNLEHVSRRTSGLSGAALSEIVNDACLNAARDHRETVNAEDFEEAVEVAYMGKPRLSAVITPNDQKITAYHEAGHTLSAMVLEDAPAPQSVSMVPRGNAGGITWMDEGDDVFLTRKRAFSHLVVMMSGRAGEEILLNGEFTSGPHGDFKAATDMALNMVTNYGMSENALMVRGGDWLSTGGKTTDETVAAVEKLMLEALQMARATLASHSDLFNALVENLITHRTLRLHQLLALKAGATIIPPTMPKPPRHTVLDDAPEVTPKNVKRRPHNDSDDDGKVSIPVPFRKKKEKVKALSIGVSKTTTSKTQAKKQSKPKK